MATAEESIRLVEANQELKPERIVVAHWALGVTFLAKGDFSRAIAALERSYRFCSGQELPASLAATEAHLGRAYALAGRFERALPLLEQAVEHSPVSLMYQRPRNLVFLSEAYLMAGRQNDACSTAEQALHLCRGHQQRGLEAEALRILGAVYSSLAPDDLSRAECSYRDAFTLSQKLEMRPLVAHCHFGLGKLYRRTGPHEPAREHLATATTMYREMGMTYWLERAEAELRQFA